MDGILWHLVFRRRHLPRSALQNPLFRRFPLMPKSVINERVDEIHLFLMLLAETKKVVLPASRISDGNLMQGRYFHVFLHEPASLPPEAPTFIVSMNNNRWAIIDFDVAHVYRLSTPRSRCSNISTRETHHMGMRVRYDVHTCQMVHRRRIIQKQCGCQAWWPPVEAWPHNQIRFCGSLHSGIEAALQDFQCIYRVDPGFKQEFYSIHKTTNTPISDAERYESFDDCREPCSERIYTPQLHGGEYETEVLHGLFTDYYLSMYIRELSEKCAGNSVNRRKRCDNVQSIVRQLSNDPINIDFEPLGDDLMNRRKQSNLLREAFPWPSMHKTVFNSSESEIKKSFLFLGIRPREPHVAVDQETLVWNMWTMLAQVGGASSFIAGVTFVVIGELLELLYHICHLQDHGKRTKYPKTNQSNKCCFTTNRDIQDRADYCSEATYVTRASQVCADDFTDDR